MRLAHIVLRSITFFAIGLTAPLGFAEGSAREFGPFVGGSLTKDMATVTQPGVNASLSGSSASAELGFDLPFTDTFGVSMSAEVGQKELRNTSQSTTYLDDTKINMRVARGSIFYKNFYFGGTYQMAGIDLETISTTSGASSAHIDTTGNSYFAGYAINYRNLLRAEIEGSGTQYQATNFKYTDYSVGLKLKLLLSGFFDK